MLHQALQAVAGEWRELARAVGKTQLLPSTRHSTERDSDQKEFDRIVRLLKLSSEEGSTQLSPSARHSALEETAREEIDRPEQTLT
ncbi:hypothetical protein, partial [Zavarzinella formosa]|uniref:hypothetical protein n=1 Tax=Zavarzinella formosa TaxID=360055 RepID=UPI001EE64A30